VRTLRIAITGRVQGVSFRDWMRAEAQALGLGGWVRNRHDGSVEAVISGEPKRVEDMLARCRRGPSAARVGDIVVLSEEDAPCTGFAIRPSV
jgi:acylphosphatase